MDPDVPISIRSRREATIAASELTADLASAEELVWADSDDKHVLLNTVLSDTCGISQAG